LLHFFGKTLSDRQRQETIKLSSASLDHPQELVWIMSANANNEPTELFEPFTDDIEVTHSATAQDLEEFDPFQIGATSPTEKKVSPAKNRPRKAGPSGGSLLSKGSSALPPRLDVKFKVHEEISSTADTEGENEGSSSVFVEGIVMVSNVVEWKHNRYRHCVGK
jgi:hypothetical protein